MGLYDFKFAPLPLVKNRHTTITPAVDVRDGKTYAVKILRLYDYCEGRVTAIDPMKLQNCKRVRHPNIVTLFECFDVGDERMFVYEHVKAHELFLQIPSIYNYCENIAAQLITSLTLAVNCLHRCGIVHQNIKPRNLLLETNRVGYKLKVCDFPLAHIVGTEPVLSNYTGMPDFIAPEIIRGEGHGKTSVDCWSIGVVLYFMLCGYPPFFKREGENDAAMFERVMAGNYDFHQLYWKDISESAKDLVTGLLNTDPYLRYTVHDILVHPWITGIDKTVPTTVLTQTLVNLKEMATTSNIQATFVIRHLLDYEREREVMVDAQNPRMLRKSSTRRNSLRQRQQKQLHHQLQQEREKHEREEQERQQEQQRLQQLQVQDQQQKSEQPDVVDVPHNPFVQSEPEREFTFGKDAFGNSDAGLGYTSANLPAGNNIGEDLPARTFGRPPTPQPDDLDVLNANNRIARSKAPRKGGGSSGGDGENGDKPHKKLNEVDTTSNINVNRRNSRGDADGDTTVYSEHTSMIVGAGSDDETGTTFSIGDTPFQKPSSPATPKRSEPPPKRSRGRKGGGGGGGSSGSAFLRGSSRTATVIPLPANYSQDNPMGGNLKSGGISSKSSNNESNNNNNNNIPSSVEMAIPVLGRQEALDTLRQGQVFTKYCSNGTQHPRTVWLSADLTRVCWSSGEGAREERPGFLSRLMQKIFPSTGMKSILTSQITKVEEGLMTEVLQAHGRMDRKEFMFSIVTPTRTLDLDSPSPRVREIWAASIRTLFNIESNE